MITYDKLAIIKARAEAGTPNLVNMPEGDFFGELRDADKFNLIAVMPELDDRTADFELFAAARDDILALVNEIEQLRGLL